MDPKIHCLGRLEVARLHPRYRRILRAVERIRVLLVGLPGVLLGIVRGVIEDAPDIVVVGEVQDPRNLDDDLARTGADLVIWGVRGDGDVPRHASLFDRHPHLTVLAVLHDGRDGFLWQLRPHRKVLGELSPRQLPAAIRRVVWD
jgi:hypothetical protein